MSPLLAGFAYVSLFVTMAGGEKPGALSQKEIGEIKMKILDLREKISKLSQEEQALQKQLDEANKVATKRVVPYVKVEVKGTLKEVIPSMQARETRWKIDAGDPGRWALDFGAHKNLLELAEKQKGRAVVITGHLVLQRNNPASFDEIVLVVATLKAAE